MAPTEICIKCGNPIDPFDDPLIGKHCKRCTEQSGAFIECLFCIHLDLLKTPPCSKDIIRIKDGKCLDYTKRISLNDLMRVLKNRTHLFDLVN